MGSRSLGRQWVQGDVLIIESTKRPKRDAKPLPLEGGRIVLAHGEATGHAHAIEAIPGVALYDLGDGHRLLVNESEGTIALKHEEHATQLFAPGTYEIRVQREYDAERERRVAD